MTMQNEDRQGKWNCVSNEHSRWMLPPWNDGCTIRMFFREDQSLTNERKTCMLFWYMSCEMIMVLFSYNESILNLHINYPSTSL